ncbi:MAG: hypothetical protein HYZ87_04015, partial [Candidatus Omnitrophica bacterium]|nr:hypothetical protein [Candidatus Omnitrophota bacterium]
MLKENKAIAEGLILDELFDLSLYQALRERASEDLQKILGELIPIETKHYLFWQEFYRIKIEKLDCPRRVKLSLVKFMSQMFGDTGIYLVL